MRTLGYLISFGLLALSLGGLGHWAWRTLDKNELAAYLSGRIEKARPSSAYLPYADRWLEFPLSGKGSNVHIISNASVHRSASFSEDVIWWYAFRYQLLDSKGELLHEGDYHHRTRVTRYRDPRHDRVVTRTFLLDPLVVPTDSRLMVVPIRDHQRRPARLRLRVSHTDAALRDVMFRVYEQESLAAHKLAYRWQRLSEPQKELLARGNIYGADLLRGAEKSNLLSQRWRPAGPAGIEHSGYRTRKLYVLQETLGEPVDEQAIPYGLYVDRNTNGVIPLPEGPATIHLQWLAVDKPGSAPAGEQILLRWYGRNLGQRSETRVALTAPEGQLEAAFAEGLLEVVSAQPIVLRAFAADNDTTQEITPDPLRLRAYYPDSSLPVTFLVDHVGQQATPVRIDVRAVLSPTAATAEETAGQTAHYEIVGRNGKVISSGTLQPDLTPSRYERLSSTERDVRLSEPAHHYFLFDHDVAAIRLHASGRLLMTAYSRPFDLVRELHLPEDVFGMKREERQPAWFVLRPANEQELLMNLRSEHVVLQDRPPTDDPQLLAGQYDWEEYQPDGPWRGRYLLIPREAGLPVRDEARVALYHELPANQDVAAVLRDFAGHRELRPTLIFERESEQPASVSLLVDGSPVYETSIIGRRGELRLPVVAAGQRRILIRSSVATRWFMNFLDTDGPAFLRRLALQIGSGGLEFHYLKRSPDQEVLTARFYQSGKQRMRLRVDIDHLPDSRLVPAGDWTFIQRTYDLRPEDNGRVSVLNTRAATVDDGQRFFLPLGSDLPPGSYRIRIRPLQDADGYLVLYRLVPGQQRVRAFLREHAYVD
jgi:hypothetical protein